MAKTLIGRCPQNGHEIWRLDDGTIESCQDAGRMDGLYAAKGEVVKVFAGPQLGEPAVTEQSPGTVTIVDKASPMGVPEERDK